MIMHDILVVCNKSSMQLNITVLCSCENEKKPKKDKQIKDIGSDGLYLFQYEYKEKALP